MGNKDGDATTRGGRLRIEQWQQGHIATTLMVTTKGSGGIQQSATMRGAQSPKRKDVRLTTVRGGGGEVRHGVLVCRRGEEGGGRHAGG
jgi:hypothetical protein